MEQEIEEKGRVVKTVGSRAYIEIKKRDECSACGACNFGKKDTLLFVADSVQGLVYGDEVILSMPRKKALSAPLIVFLLPLLTLGLGIFLGGLINTVCSYIFAVVGAVLGGVLVFLIDKQFSKRDELKPHIRKILTKNIETEKGDIIYGSDTGQE